MAKAINKRDEANARREEAGRFGERLDILDVHQPHRLNRWPVAQVRSHWPRPGIGTGYVLRFHAGLEDADDLIEDVEQAFHAMKEA